MPDKKILAGAAVLLGAALEGGASDVRRDGDIFEVLTAPQCQRFGRGTKGQLIAAERATVLTRLPNVELGFDQQQRHGQAIAADRLR